MWHRLTQLRQFLGATPDAVKMGKGFVCPTLYHVFWHNGCPTDFYSIFYDYLSIDVRHLSESIERTSFPSMAPK
jgi:hypothetical protein